MKDGFKAVELVVSCMIWVTLSWQICECLPMGKKASKTARTLTALQVGKCKKTRVQ